MRLLLISRSATMKELISRVLAELPVCVDAVDDVMGACEYVKDHEAPHIAIMLGSDTPDVLARNTRTVRTALGNCPLFVCNTCVAGHVDRDPSQLLAYPLSSEQLTLAVNDVLHGQ